MKKYFEKQINSIDPLTEETIESMKQARIDAGLSTASLESYVPGDKLLFAMVYEENIDRPQVNLVNLLEKEIDEFCQGREFVDMTGPKQQIPRFR